MIRFNSLQIFTIATLLNFNIGNSVTSIIPEDVNNTDDISDVCTTVTCNVTAATILDNMNTSVNPCDDFYEFACGGFIEKHQFSNDSVTSWTEAENTNMLRLKALLEESSPADEAELIKQAKNFYKSCVNESAIEERGVAPLLNALKELGGWPVIEGNSWNESNFDWINLSNEFHNTGFLDSIFFRIIHHPPYQENDTENKLEINFAYEPPAPLMKRMGAPSLIEYKNQMVDVAVLLGASRDNAIEELEESLLFGMALENIISLSQMQYEQEMNQTTDFMTITELCDTYPTIPWKTLINNTLAPYATMHDDDIVKVYESKLFERFLRLMAKTPKRVQANFMMWEAILPSIPYLNNEIREIFVTVDDTSRWKTCVKSNYPGFGTALLYMTKYHNETVKRKATELGADVKNEMINTIQKMTWMDNETKRYALDRIKAMEIIIGCEDELYNYVAHHEFYKNMEFDDTKYFENHLKLRRSEIDFQYKSFRDPDGEFHENMLRTCEDVVGQEFYHHLYLNAISLTAGSFQGLMFNIHHPNYLNYGAMGHIVGHELSHDLFHRNIQEEIWTASTKEAFSNKSNCFVEQFNNYTVEEIGKKLNGSQTEIENLADHGGMKISYSAYDNWLKIHEKEQSLPGLKYNPRQMYWIATANTWCAKLQPKDLEERVAHNNHSPDKYRVLGTFSNSPEFARDFNCPVGSNMNPENKCTIF